MRGRRAAALESLVPRVLAGRYRLEQRIGRGGMGSVYAAIDQSLERRVAVKVLRNDLVESADALKRFHREARAAASFVHPNVVTVHDFGATTSARAFLIMELLEGVTLRDELRIGGRLPLPHTLQILQGVCAAIDAAHGQGLVHRDLKPENIFLARSPQGEIAKILDFGIAKAVKPEPHTQAAETSVGILLGYPEYMAPEQLRGGAVQPTWDLWAIAVTAYEMLNDVHPFESATAMTMDALALRDAGGFLTRSAGPTSSWDAFFVRALAIDPRQRPASAVTFFAELGEAVSR